MSSCRCAAASSLAAGRIINQTTLQQSSRTNSPDSPYRYAVLVQHPVILSSKDSKRTMSSVPEKTKIYHEPPMGVDYATNSTVFGKILRGEATARVLKESTTLLAFCDIAPCAPLHALIIPKKHIKDLNSLQSRKDLDAMNAMHNMAEQVLRDKDPKAWAEKDYMLCYHVPPFTMIPHLHLHVLAPASQLSMYGKLLFWLGTPWCVSGDVAMERVAGRVTTENE